MVPELLILMKAAARNIKGLSKDFKEVFSKGLFSKASLSDLPEALHLLSFLVRHTKVFGCKGNLGKSHVEGVDSETGLKCEAWKDFGF